MESTDGRDARPLMIALAGDVMLGRLVNRTIAKEGFAYPWGDLLPFLREPDLFLINLECALTTRTKGWHDGYSKTFYFRADPPVVETLKLGRVDFTALANNHICDFGAEGLQDTIQTLDEAGIAHAGAGRDRAEARAPAILSACGWKIAVVAFADHLEAWAATDTSPGINYVPIALIPEAMQTVEHVLAAARRRADLVIASFHWGPNMQTRPTPHFRELARRVIDMGADIFWGHSAHVPQGIEFRGGSIILYDTGDFVDDYAVDPALRNDLSALYLVRVAPPRIEGVELLPVRIRDMQVNRARGNDRDWIVHRLGSLCAEMETDVVEQHGKETLSAAGSRARAAKSCA